MDNKKTSWWWVSNLLEQLELTWIFVKSIEFEVNTCYPANTWPCDTNVMLLTSNDSNNALEFSNNFQI